MPGFSLRWNFGVNCLARQPPHSDHLGEVLKVQERELEAKFDVRLSEHIQKEKENFERQVAGWVARLHGIEVAIDSNYSINYYFVSYYSFSYYSFSYN